MKLAKTCLFLSAMTAMLVGLAGSALAQTETRADNLSVTAHVKKACRIVAGTLSFGDYEPSSLTPKDATGSLSVYCTQGTAASITMGTGGHAGTGTIRNMVNTDGAQLEYHLYTDGAGGNEWAGSTAVSVVTTSNGLTPVPIYGRIPINQNVPEGNYADTVVASISF